MMVDSTVITNKDDSINLYANIDLNCDEYDSWRPIDTIVPIDITNSNKECNAHKSLPNILLPLKSKQISSQSLLSCLKFSISTSSKTKIDSIEKKKSNPTIGDLLGDDDSFHSQYHNQYSSSRSKRKRYYRHSLSSHNSIPHREEQRMNYYTPSTNQVYLNPNYTTYPGYYYYSNITACCPCLITDPYVGLYQQGICYETSQQYYQSSKKYKYSDCHNHEKKRWR
jgi:hypothetical protein